MRGLWRLVSAAAALGAGVVGAAESRGQPPGPLCFETPIWPGELRYPGDLAIRAGNREGTLYLRRRGCRGLYRFQATSRSLSLVPDSHWERTPSPIALCSEQSVPAGDGVHLDRRTDRLFVGSRPVTTRGRLALAWARTVDHRRIVILTADGDRAVSLLPFLGRGGASGKHFQEVFTLPDGRPVGSPIRLPFQSERATYHPCWTAGGQYVVYSDASASQLCIVPSG